MGECSWKYGNTTRSGVWRCGGIKIEHVEVVAVSGSRDAGGTCQYAAGSDTVQTYVHREETRQGYCVAVTRWLATVKECRVRPRKCAVNSKTTVNCERVRGESKEKSSATTQIWNVTREVGQRQEEPATCVGGRTVIYFVSELENSDTCKKCTLEDSEYIDIIIFSA